MVHSPVRGGKFPGAAAAREAIRHARPARDDHGNLHCFRRAAGDYRIYVLDWRIERPNPNHRMDGHLLFRLSRRKQCLSDRERDLSAGSEGLAIALFYCIGTGIGGVAGPALFGALVDSGSRNSLFAGYLLGSVLMVGAGAIAWRYGVAAERRTLESIARPLAGVGEKEKDEDVNEGTFAQEVST